MIFHPHVEQCKIGTRPCEPHSVKQAQIVAERNLGFTVSRVIAQLKVKRIV